MFNRILVPLDGSELAERAIMPAISLLEPLGLAVFIRASSLSTAGEYELIEQFGQPTAGSMLEKIYQQEKEYLNNVQSKYASPKITIKAHYVLGDPAGRIVDEAAVMQADLIVMSSHGYSGLTRWLLGSVAERVLQAAPCPVLLIRQPQPIQRVLITLDGTNLAEQALGPGLALAQKLDADVTLLQVVEKKDVERSLKIDDQSAGLSQYRESAADEYLEATAKSHRLSGMDIRTEIRIGPVALNILETADALESDLIVMATHGRTGLRRWTYGSITQKVLHKCKLSMLLVRP